MLTRWPVPRARNRGSTSFMPWRTSASAVARPMPRAAPVMAATRPVRILASLAMAETYRPCKAGGRAASALRAELKPDAVLPADDGADHALLAAIRPAGGA